MTQLLTSRRTKRAANVLGIVLLIAVVAPFAVFAVPEVVGADESFVVLTASMTPAIAPGDAVIVAERDPAAVAEGDVITFVRGTSDVPVTHRVIGVVDEGGALAFETRGDANEGPDPGLVPAANLIGAVTLTIPYVGYVIQFAGTRAGFVALVLLPFGLLAATEVWSLVRGRDEPEERPTTADSADESVDGEAGAPTSVAAAEVAEVDKVPDSAAASGSGGVSVDAVGGAAAVLAAVAPYAAYVAFELRSAVAIAAATAAATLLFAALATWVPASGVLDRSDSTATAAAAAGESPSPAAADGGVTATEPEADETDANADETDANADETDAEAAATDADGVPAEESATASTPPARPDAAGEVD